MENLSEKSRPLSVKQKQTLVEYVHSRPEMHRGKFSATYTYATSVILWKDITGILNSIPGGSRKEWKQWRKTFVDIKKNIKSKHAKTKAHSSGTGGGPPLSPLKDEETDKGTEEKMLEIITPVAITGNFEVPEPQFIFEDYGLDDSVLADDSSILWEDSPQPGPSKEIPKPLVGKKAMYKENIPAEQSKRTGKRLTKSERLSQSIRTNKEFLSISQSGILSTESYREKKLDILRTQVQNEENYHREALGMLRTIAHAFTTIAEKFASQK